MKPPLGLLSRSQNNSLTLRLGFLALAYAVGLGLILPSFANLIISCGHFIAQTDLVTDYGTALIWATLIGLSILIWPVSFQNRMALLLLWAVRVGVTLGFMLLYESYYGLDAMEYFRTTPPWSMWAATGKAVNGTDNITYLFWLHNQILPYSFHTMKVSCALIGLIGVYLFYRAAVLYWGREDLRILYLLGFCPSILFWASTLGKDPLAMLGIALFFYGVMGFTHRYQVYFLGLAVVGLLLAMYIRLWLGPILLMPIVALAFFSARTFQSRVLLACGSLALFFLLLGPILNRFSLDSLQDALQFTDAQSKAWGRGGSAQQLDMQFTSVGSMLRFLPLGIFTALFRPLPGEIMNPFGLLSGLENLGLLVLLWRAIKRTRWKEFRDPIILWATLSVLCWAAIYAFVSYQNLGAAVRFRLQILPVLLLLLLYLARRRSPDPILETLEKS